MRRLVLSILFSLATSCSGSPDDARPFPAVPADDGLPTIAARAGMAQQLVWGADAASKQVRDGQIARLRSLGVQNERVDFTWHKVEREPGVFDFSALDPMVQDATDAGIALLAVAAYGNPIYPSERTGGAGTDLPLDARPEVFFPPTDPQHYADYVRAIVRRYGRVVKRFELWNEENLGYRFWRPAADGAAYARYIEPAARAGREECADCKFSVGGLSMPQPIPRLELYPKGPQFLEAMYAAKPELPTFLDAVAFHPYPMPKDPPEKETAAFEDRFQGSLATQTAQIRDVVRAHGRDLPLWITENGWPTNARIPETDADIARVFGLDTKIIQFGRALLGDEDFAKVLETIRGVSEGDQARYLVRSVLLAAREGIPLVVLYGLDDYPIEPEMNQESAFGVFRVDGTEKRGAPALRTLIRRFGAYRFAADVREAVGLDASARALAFRDGAKILLAVWRWEGGDARVILRDLPGDAVVFDLLGTETSRVARGGRLDVAIGPDVTYVEITP